MYIHQYLIGKIGKDCFGIVNDYLVGYKWRLYYLEELKGISAFRRFLSALATDIGIFEY